MPDLSPDRREFWKKHTAQQEKSGLTIKAYALANGLNLQSFYTWRSSLNKKQSVARSVDKGASATFAKVVGLERARCGSPMRIRVGGVLIEFDDAPSPEWLHRFLQLRGGRA